MFGCTPWRTGEATGMHQDFIIIFDYVRIFATSCKYHGSRCSLRIANILPLNYLAQTKSDIIRCLHRLHSPPNQKGQMYLYLIAGHIHSSFPTIFASELSILGRNFPLGAF